MKNLLKDKLARGGKPIGTFFELGSPTVAEALGRSGLDFIIVDCEHGPFEAESARDFIVAAELAGLAPLARVRETGRSALLKLLDVGAQGLVVPDVHSLEQVRELVEYAKFSPLGKRGYCPSRKDGWGFDPQASGSLEAAMRWNNSETLLIPQCETVGCLKDIRAIAALEGVDGIFVGPFDLSISMGIPGQFERLEFKAALSSILEACREAGKFCMYFTVDPAQVAAGFRLGFDAMTYSLDARVLIQAYRDDLAKIRAAM